VYDEARNLGVLARLMLLVEALEGLADVLAGEVVAQGDDCRVLEDRPQLFEKHYHRQL
jgi:hypothetical protein